MAKIYNFPVKFQQPKVKAVCQFCGQVLTNNLDRVTKKTNILECPKCQTRMNVVAVS